ncbi:MAG: trypsin-like peptidase domain-containing protein [Candidatus Planktophila sp.]|nr:trypsin-like peptidase domain-containing protein [Candidatus Planktophila sp.]
MIFPRVKNPNPASGAWWQAPAPSKSAKGNLVLIALLAGSLGGFLGVNAAGGSLFREVNLVSSTSTIERAPDSVAGIAQRVLPSVVSINTRTLNSGGSGSGFVIDSNGYILTNNHVISDAVISGGKIQVTLNDGTTYTGKVIGRDASFDLAVLKIDAIGLKALQFGDSDKIAVGDAVIAIGSPLGLSGTVTTGIISAKDRAVTTGDSRTESSFINALQTDAAINPGNSGGPLVDSTGAVIGINSAIASLGTTSQAGSIGLGFAIPINQGRKIADQLIKYGVATYPVVGISLDVNYMGVGAQISTSGTGILPGSPAQKAGLKAGDVIIEFDGKKINSPEELIVSVRSKNVGDRVTLVFVRDGVEKSVTLNLIAAKK